MKGDTRSLDYSSNSSQLQAQLNERPAPLEDKSARSRELLAYNNLAGGGGGGFRV